jgi:hypothetical protein
MLDPKQRDAIAISHFFGTAEIREHGTELKKIAFCLLHDQRLSTLKAKNRCGVQDRSSNIFSEMKPIPYIPRVAPVNYIQESSESVKTVRGNLSLTH